MQWVTVAGLRRYWGNPCCKATLLGEPGPQLALQWEPVGVWRLLQGGGGVDAQKVVFQETLVCALAPWGTRPRLPIAPSSV